MTGGDKKIESYPQYVETVLLHSSASYVALFRGQSVADEPLPAVARKDCILVSSAPSPAREQGAMQITHMTMPSERVVLDQLKSQGALVLGKDFEHNLDYLVMAQHHGLKTRLLDWTSDPSVALWFACRYGKGEEEQDKDVYVYMYVADGAMEGNPYRPDFDPFGIDKTVVFQPRWNNPRIVAQKGWFSIHALNPYGFKFHGLSCPDDRQTLFKFTISGRFRRRILRDLDRFGVNERAMFPDLSGLCSYLNYAYYENLGRRD